VGSVLERVMVCYHWSDGKGPFLVTVSSNSDFFFAVFLKISIIFKNISQEQINRGKCIFPVKLSTTKTKKTEEKLNSSIEV